MPADLKVADNSMYPVGSQALIKTDDMLGMMDYVSSSNGEEVENHKWVIESELAEIK